MMALAIPEQIAFDGAPHLQTASEHERVQSDRSMPANYIGDLDGSSLVEPEKALAAGVLRQAAADLRRFRESRDSIGREMYSDARNWFVSSDTAWPYSFLNVCDSLGLSPENVRDEVFEDAVSNWAAHSGRIAWATAIQLVGSVSNLFSHRRAHTLAVRHS